MCPGVPYDLNYRSLKKKYYFQSTLPQCLFYSFYLRYIVAPDQTLLASIRYYVTSYFKRSSFQAIVRYKICGNRVKKMIIGLCVTMSL